MTEGVRPQPDRRVTPDRSIIHEERCPACPDGRGQCSGIALSERGRRFRFTCQVCHREWSRLEPWAPALS